MMSLILKRNGLAKTRQRVKFVVVQLDIVLVGREDIAVASSYVVDFAIVVACDSFVEDDTWVDHCNCCKPSVVVVVVVVDWKRDCVYWLVEMVNWMKKVWEKKMEEESIAVEYWRVSLVWQFDSVEQTFLKLK